MNVVSLERWLSKQEIAEHLSCSTRFIDLQVAKGMPYARIAGRRKFRASEVELWLEQRGEMERFAS